VPQVYSNVPAFLNPITGSSLSLAVVVAVALNQLLGWKPKAQKQVN
jgi:xanthine/uracil permease